MLTIRIITNLIKLFNISSSALAPLLGNPGQNNHNDHVLSNINSLLPNSAFLEEVRATGLVIERVEKLGPLEFLNLLIFMILNNFPRDAKSEHLYEWLKNYGTTYFLTALSLINGPTAKALLENFFRCAVQAKDIPIVKHLIKAGVSPNRLVCRHP
jgi:hypothetical protein